ncbi:MAG TPA: protein kinase, partial [Kofleriaceae bacterium]|nr:protein kinase [Kofleriaceae bacterium]
DFKPDNVLVVQERGGETPRIVDFGLAIFADNQEDAARLTSAGTVVGTPIYTAPEQAMDRGVDHRVDLFALGISMYEMLAGLPPFADTGLVETLHHNLASRRPPIAERSPGVAVPPALERIVHRLMSSDREQRYQTSHEVIDALDALDRPAPVDHARTMSETTWVDPSRRWRRLRFAAVLAIAAGVGLAAAALVWSPRPRTPAALRVAAGEGARAALTPERAGSHGAATGGAAGDEAGSAQQASADELRAGERSASEPRVVELIAVDGEAAAPPPATAPFRRLRSGGAQAARPGRRARVSRRDPGELDAAPAAVAEPRGEDAAADPALAPAATGNDIGPASRAPPAATAAAAPAAGAEPLITPADQVALPAPRGEPAPPGRGPAPRPALAPAPLRPALEGLAVTGSLSNAEVRRAVERVMPRMSGCSRAAGGRVAPGVRVTFTVDENGRAREIRASAADAPELAACVSDALSAVRSRVAPDVGEVRVSLRVVFGAGGAR